MSSSLAAAVPRRRPQLLAGEALDGAVPVQHDRLSLGVLDKRGGLEGGLAFGIKGGLEQLGVVHDLAGGVVVIQGQMRPLAKSP